jgi:predicted MFS family arabinose efflux permease
VAGYVVDWAGYNAAFLFLASCAAVALLVLWLMAPETQAWAQKKDLAKGRRGAAARRLWVADNL